MDGHGRVLDRFDNADGVHGLDDVAVAPDGNVYWTEPFSGKVKKLTTSGMIVSIAQLPPGANGITISPDGREASLFVKVQTAGMSCSWAFVGPPTSPTWLSLTTVAVSPTSNDLYVAGDNADGSRRNPASVIYRIKR